MGKHKHKNLGRQKSTSGVMGTLETLGEEVDQRCDSLIVFGEELIRDMQDSSEICSDLVHNVQGVCVRAKRGFNDAIHGKSGTMEQILRGLQDLVREAKHNLDKRAKDFNRTIDHYSEHFNEVKEFLNKVENFFSRLVEKINNLIKEIKQNGMSSIFSGGPGQQHGKHIEHSHEQPLLDKPHKRNK